MVSHLSRRRVLAGCGVLAGSVLMNLGLIDGATRINAVPQNNDLSEWPMEQHDPGGTSYAPDASPPKDSVRVRWKHQLTRTSSIHPSPIVANGLVYGVGEELVCADAASGDVVFHIDRAFRNPPAVTHARAYHSPTLAFGIATGAVGLNARGGITVGNHHIGLIRWWASREEGDLSLFTFGATQNIPVAANGTVFVMGSGGLRAIDGSSGRIRWRNPGGLTRPAVHEGTVYVADYQKGIIGYDINTGEQTISIGEAGATSVTATTDGLIVTASSGLYSFDYDETGRWVYDRSVANGMIAVADGVVYTWSSDGLIAIDATNGLELWRSEPDPQGISPTGPLAVADGVVYVPTDLHGLVAVDATDGHIRWRFTLDDKYVSWSPVALAGETLYALGNGILYALEER